MHAGAYPVCERDRGFEWRISYDRRKFPSTVALSQPLLTLRSQLDEVPSYSNLYPADTKFIMPKGRERTGASEEGEMTASIQTPTIMPPHHIIKNFLDETSAARLLDHAIKTEANYKATRIDEGDGDPWYRASLRTGDLGPMRKELESRILALSPLLISQLRVTPFEPARIEMEIVAHGDGAFYKPHFDTTVGKADGKPTQRMVTAVYYFYSLPKAFSGGALRLYAFGTKQSNVAYIDVEAGRNTLVAFPSWALHEVLPIGCPSRIFANSRFALNFWLHRRTPGT